MVILGAGGHAKVVLATALDAGFSVAAFLDEDPGKWGGSVLGVPVRGGFELLKSGRGLSQAVVAIGDNQARKRIADSYDRCCEWVTLVHPSAYVHRSVVLGRGTVVFAGSCIQPEAVIGDHVIVNTGATIDHDCRIGDFCHLAPGVHLGGNITAAEGTFLGIGSRVIPGSMIGEWSVIGAGSAVIRDVPRLSRVAGVPARQIRKE
ncbi:MAG: acetyltransferase [Firmicutes bacterium]|nr:acetyltransferase [Bacillota bacterium]